LKSSSCGASFSYINVKLAYNDSKQPLALRQASDESACFLLSIGQTSISYKQLNFKYTTKSFLLQNYRKKQCL